MPYTLRGALPAGIWSLAVNVGGGAPQVRAEVFVTRVGAEPELLFAGESNIPAGHPGGLTKGSISMTKSLGAVAAACGDTLTLRATVLSAEPVHWHFVLGTP